jgi:hypothetical protein
MNKNTIELLKHIVKRWNSDCNQSRGEIRVNCKKECPVFIMCGNRIARAKEAQRLLNLHTSIIAQEGEY